MFTLRKLVGWVIVVIPFLVIFVACTVTEGFLIAVGVFAFVISIAFVIGAGVYLIATE